MTELLTYQLSDLPIEDLFEWPTGPTGEQTDQPTRQLACEQTDQLIGWLTGEQTDQTTS